MMGSNPFLEGLASKYALKTNTGYVSLDDLEGDEHFIGAEITVGLRKSISMFGIINPIIISSKTKDDGKYSVIDGKRRVKTARMLVKSKVMKKPKILARMLVIDGEDLDQQLVYAMLEGTSSTNHAFMIDCVAGLYATGFAEYQIHKYTGLTHSAVKNYLQIAFDLDGDLMIAFQEGRIRYPVAQRASKAPKMVQSRLAKYLEDGGHVSVGNVRKESEKYEKEMKFLQTDLKV